MVSTLFCTTVTFSGWSHTAFVFLCFKYFCNFFLRTPQLYLLKAIQAVCRNKRKTIIIVTFESTTCTICHLRVVHPDPLLLLQSFQKPRYCQATVSQLSTYRRNTQLFSSSLYACIIK